MDGRDGSPIEYTPKPIFKMPRAGKYPARLDGFDRLPRGKQKELITVWRQRKANEERLAQWNAARQRQRSRTRELSERFAEYKPKEVKSD